VGVVRAVGRGGAEEGVRTWNAGIAGTCRKVAFRREDIPEDAVHTQGLGKEARFRSLWEDRGPVLPDRKEEDNPYSAGGILRILGETGAGGRFL
jgi:hypothetical protein